MDPKGAKDQSKSANSPRSIIQIVWGSALLLAGIGVFYRIPAVMQQVVTIEQFAAAPWIVRLSFYLLGIILVVAGIKKISAHIQTIKGRQE